MHPTQLHYIKTRGEISHSPIHALTDTDSCTLLEFFVVVIMDTGARIISWDTKFLTPLSEWGQTDQVGSWQSLREGRHREVLLPYGPKKHWTVRGSTDSAQDRWGHGQLKNWPIRMDRSAHKYIESSFKIMYNYCNRGFEFFWRHIIIGLVLLYALAYVI